MRSMLSAMLFLALATPVVATPAPSAFGGGAPETRMMAQDSGAALQADWSKRLTDTEAVTRPGGDLDKADVSLNALQAWYEQNKDALAKVPDYRTLMPRQLNLQVKLARLTAVRALVDAEGAVKQASPTLAESANTRLARADALAASIAGVLGANHEAVVALNKYISDVRGKVQARLAQVGSGSTRASSARLHPYTVQTFDTWCKNMAEDEEHLRSSEPVEKKVRELEGGARWFESSVRELRKHPDFSQKAPQMRALLFSLAELKGKLALEMADKGLREMNPNYFSESSGIAQQFKEADAIIERCTRELGEDEAGVAAARASLKASREAVDKVAETYAKKSAASFRIPAEAYHGADKERLRQMIVTRWKALYPKDQILLVRFVKPSWEQRKETTYNHGTFYHYDNSSLLAYVVVKKSAELGTAYPVYVNRNNKTGALNVGAETKGSGYSHQDVLLKNVR